MATNTTKNYSDEMVKQIIADYTANPTMATVNDLAETTGKTVRSLIAKLSREGVYQKKERTTKSGAIVQTKADIVKLISAKADVDEASISSLTKASKYALQTLLTAIT